MIIVSLGEDYGRIGIKAGTLSQWLVNGITTAGRLVVCLETLTHDGAFEGAADQQKLATMREGLPG